MPAISISLYVVEQILWYRLKEPFFLWFCTLIFSLGIPDKASAGLWRLDKLDAQYQISIRGQEHDQLTLSHEGTDTLFVLTTASSHTPSGNTHRLQLWFDDRPSVTDTSMTRLDKRSFLIHLTSSEKNDIIHKMITGIKLQIRYPITQNTYRNIRFSLLGFTAALNDLLIAHEIGHLDPEWLNENHKTQELMCYYAADFSVLSMLHRKQGLIHAESVSRLKREYGDELGEVITNIVTQVYAMPHDRLPRDPRGDKFGIFQRCMQGYKNSP